MPLGGHAHIDPSTNTIPASEINGVVPSAIPVQISEGGTNSTNINTRKILANSNSYLSFAVVRITD